MLSEMMALQYLSASLRRTQYRTLAQLAVDCSLSTA